MASTRKELAMSHTKWIDYCCHVLEVEQEAPTDVYATAFIKVRCLVQRIGERFSYDDHISALHLHDTVVQMSVNGFKKELAELEATPAFSSTQNNCE
ncbi:hypothetical protein A1O3_04062 [Capronia epimyces CBS 606.96]|uniref:Uncharacterized protein n=1 Tax=Capronia epimyces CBS 606.96 TaxID=1182542 RepID=W9YXT0_9EURO|nr:uncharacterized protein A1O3_04062 [Capronia epimyces CBS 606.96]EXJ87104.1 hypothetical protein A1O3_04062 [Capronia epimyces CBS 606.96]